MVWDKCVLNLAPVLGRDGDESDVGRPGVWADGRSRQRWLVPHVRGAGKAVYYTACSLLVILKNSCSKLHCQKGFYLNPFSYKIEREGVTSRRSSRVSLPQLFEGYVTRVAPHKALKIIA